MPVRFYWHYFCAVGWCFAMIGPVAERDHNDDVAIILSVHLDLERVSRPHFTVRA